MDGDISFSSGDIWSLDQLFGFFPSDDHDMAKAQEGLPGVSIKSETLADTQMALEALCTSPTEGSLGFDWMEQDFDFSFTPSLSPDDLPCKPISITFPTTTTASISQVRESVELENLNPEFANEFLHTLQTEPLLKLETSSSPSSCQDTTPEIHVTPEIVLDADETSALQVLQSGNIEFLQRPLSSDDVESLLSSASSLAPSPASTPSPAPSSPATIDTSILSSDSSCWSLNSSDLYKVVENTDKSRPTPYSRAPKSSKNKSKGRKLTASISPAPTDLELELMSKKDRKKLQNKNAAIRYRQKKKAETEEKRSEVDELEAINMSLHAKCEELQREVKCMKDLINDIRKAKGQPLHQF